MSSETINLTSRSRNYDPPPENKDDNASTDEPTVSTPPPANNIHFEKPILDTVFRSPKSTIRKSIFNPNVRATEY